MKFQTNTEPNGTIAILQDEELSKTDDRKARNLGKTSPIDGGYSE